MKAWIVFSLNRDGTQKNAEALVTPNETSFVLGSGHYYCHTCNSTDCVHVTDTKIRQMGIRLGNVAEFDVMTMQGAIARYEDAKAALRILKNSKPKSKAKNAFDASEFD